MFRVLPFLVIASSLSPAQTALRSSTLADSIQFHLDQPAARRAIWAIHVRGLATGETVYERNAQTPFTPASNTKLFSAALALTRLGAEHRFETRVFAATPPAADGIVRGDLTLIGGGDPSMSGRIYPYTKGKANPDALAPLKELVEQIVLAGVKRIDGDIVGDDTRYPWEPFPDGWTADDTLYEYGAPVSALFVNDSTQMLTVTPPTRNDGVPIVRVTPAVEYFTIESFLRVAPGTQRRISVDRLPGSRVLTLSGTMAPGRGAASILLAVDDPALYAATILRELLMDRGIVVRGAARARHRPVGVPFAEPQGYLVARRVSPPVSEIVQVVNKMSQNLHAEIVLREAALASGKDGSRREALDELESFLSNLGIAPDEYDFSDGSGLARRTLVTPVAITRLLQVMSESPLDGVWKASLPVAGEDGTLSGRYKGVAGSDLIRAKTGSLSHVAALSGYAGKLAFSIIVNHATAPSSEYRAVLDKIVAEILHKGSR